MTLKFFIRERAKARAKAQLPVHVRLRDGMALDQWAATLLMVDPAIWDAKVQNLKTRMLLPAELRKQVGDELQAIKTFLEDNYYADTKNGNIQDSWLKSTIKRYYSLKGQAEKLSKERVQDFQRLYDEFINSKERAESKIAQYRVVERTILRYTEYVKVVQRKRSFTFNVKKVDKKLLDDLFDYIRNEYRYYDEYKAEIFAKFPDKQPPKPRGHNTMVDIKKKVRAFFNWCETAGYVDRSPFKDYHIEADNYGTPIYLTKEELHIVHHFDYSTNSALKPKDIDYLSTQRDIFVFQCNTGPRVSDLLRLKKENVIDGALEYIPTKTIADNARTVVVPLNKAAKAIVAKYKKTEGDKLLPFILPQDYNVVIRRILALAGITRRVTVLNPLSGREEQKRICDVGASHMARRTFVANLYKQVQDPNIVASLSGHVEGSRAFSRYREIDKDIKKQIVKLLD